jgi:hypothetical protein
MAPHEEVRDTHGEVIRKILQHLTLAADPSPGAPAAAQQALVVSLLRPEPGEERGACGPTPGAHTSGSSGW